MPRDGARLCLCVAAIAVAGCGGSSHRPTPDFAARAVAVCERALQQDKQLALGGGQIVDILVKIKINEGGADRQLAALTPPASEKAAFDRFLADRHRATASLDDLTTPPTEQANLDAVEREDAVSAGIGGCVASTSPTPQPQPANTPSESPAVVAALADRRHLSRASIPVGHNPSDLAVGLGGVWVANNDGTVTRIDPKTGTVGRPFPITGLPDAIAVAQGAVFVVSEANNTVTRIDPRSGTVVATRVGSTPDAIADGGVLWVANFSDGTVVRVDPSSGQITGKPIHVGNGPAAIAVDHNVVWVANEQDNTVSRIDRLSGAVFGKATRVGKAPDSLAVGHGLVWVQNSIGHTLTRIDVNTGTVVGRPIPIVANPGGIAVGLGAVWVLAGNGHTVTRIDPSTGRVLGGPTRVGGYPSSVAVGQGGAWIVSQDRVTRIRP